MKKTTVLVIIALLIGGAVTYGIAYTQQNGKMHDLLANLHIVNEELSSTKKTLLGYTKYTDYLAITKTAMSEQMKFLAAKVDREYTQVEHIQKKKLFVQTDATIIIKYAVEYSFGYDLKPNSFTISGAKDGITVTLSKPELVASPAVKIISHEIADKGMFIDEKDAVIAFQQQLPAVAQARAKEIQNDEAVIALCEKKLAEFLRDFMTKQPNVGVIPSIRIAYK